MPETAHILALFSAALLVIAIGIWGGMLGGPLLQRLDGARASNARPAKVAVQVLLLALGLSAAAAALAIASWISP